jgi:hypothetical protein
MDIIEIYANVNKNEHKVSIHNVKKEIFKYVENCRQLTLRVVKSQKSGVL